jgi:cytochrome c peroxidase
MARSWLPALWWLLLGLSSSGCGAHDAAPAPPEAAALEAPPGFPPLPAPADNLPTAPRIALGRALFYDERLSSTEKISCASCHLQQHAFADPSPLSLGVHGRSGTRNAPALVNEAWGTSFFWHGGVPSLEIQAVGPIRNPLEMDMTLKEVALRLSADAALVKAFDEAYAEAPSESTLTRALASFVRSLVSGNSGYDRWLGGDTAAMSSAAVRGEALFNGERAECFHCHTGFDFTNHAFRNDGSAPDDPDPGRMEITLKQSDFGKFKVPTLRNVAESAPYMHDGSLSTLSDVIERYDRGGSGHPNTDPTIQPLGLNSDEKADLQAFLKALSDRDFLENPNFADPAP